MALFERILNKTLLMVDNKIWLPQKVGEIWIHQSWTYKDNWRSGRWHPFCAEKVEVHRFQTVYRAECFHTVLILMDVHTHQLLHCIQYVDLFQCKHPPNSAPFAEYGSNFPRYTYSTDCRLWWMISSINYCTVRRNGARYFNVLYTVQLQL